MKVKRSIWNNDKPASEKQIDFVKPSTMPNGGGWKRLESK